MTAFRVTIPGSPISGNHANRIGKGYRRLRDGSVGSYPKLVQTAEAEAYKTAVAMLTRTARPSGWQWSGGQIRVVYRAYLLRDMDCDNISKVLGDALSGALGIDDKFFLPCFAEKTIVKSDPRVEVTIDAERGEG